MITFDGTADAAAADATKYPHETFIQSLETITRITAEADSVTEGLTRVLDTLCVTLRWPIGHVYQLASNDSETLTSAALWHLEAPEQFAALQEMTRLTSFRPGLGLVGQVMAQRQPSLCLDVAHDKRFLRRGAAEADGVYAWLGFPILANARVIAVCEFFTTERVRLDPVLFRLLGCAGLVLGWLYERQRWRAELEQLHHQIAASAQLDQARQRSALAALAGAVVHEINSPLFAARTSLALLANGYPAAPLVASAQADLARIAAVMEQLHTLAKEAPTGQRLEQFVAPPAA